MSHSETKSVKQQILRFLILCLAGNLSTFEKQFPLNKTTGYVKSIKTFYSRNNYKTASAFNTNHSINDSPHPTNAT